MEDALKEKMISRLGKKCSKNVILAESNLHVLNRKAGSCVFGIQAKKPAEERKDKSSRFFQMCQSIEQLKSEALFQTNQKKPSETDLHSIEVIPIPIVKIEKY